MTIQIEAAIYQQTLFIGVFVLLLMWAPSISATPELPEAVEEYRRTCKGEEAARGGKKEKDFPPTCASSLGEIRA